MPVPGCRTCSLVLEHEQSPSDTGGMQQGWGGEGDISRSPPHSVGSRDYLPKSSMLSFKAPLSLTDPVAGPHIPRQNDRYSSSQAKWPLEGGWSQRILMPMIPAFSSPNTQSPSSLAHGSPSTHQNHLPPFLLAILLCPFLALPLLPSDSSSSSLRILVVLYSLGVVEESLETEAYELYDLKLTSIMEIPHRSIMRISLAFFHLCA